MADILQLSKTGLMASTDSDKPVGEDAMFMPYFDLGRAA